MFSRIKELGTALRYLGMVATLLLSACNATTHIPGGGRQHSNEIPRISVEKLVSEFSIDEDGTRKRYMDRVVEVFGKVGIAPSTLGGGKLELRLTASMSTIHGVDCLGAPGFEASLLALLGKKNIHAAIRGTFKGGGHPFLLLEDCLFIDTELPWDQKKNDDTIPIGGFLGGDRATGDRISHLLSLNGIDDIQYGSVGYTVAVPTTDAARAREILRNAIHVESLRASVYEERPLPGRER